MSRLPKLNSCSATSVLVAILAGPFVLSPAVAETAVEAQLRARLETGLVTDSLEVMDDRIHARETLRRVYSERAYRALWVSEDALLPGGTRLIGWLEDGPSRQGLRASDYHLEVVEELDEARRPEALVDLELALSDAFLMVGSHFLAGRLNPETLDPEWRASRRHRDLGPVLVEAAGSEDPGRVLESLLPDADGYRALVQRLADLRRVRDTTGWSTVDEGPTLREGDQGPRVGQLVERLLASGDYVGGPTQRLDADVSAAVRRFQMRHGLTPDGLVGRVSLGALNAPIQDRIDETIVNLERWRWLPESLGNRHVIVNIAGFSLDVVEDAEVTMSMDVVVGRPYRRTPVFSGVISYLVLNPSWEVPSSIAAQDKLPLLRANPGYLREQGYTLLRGWGADERVVNPDEIDWSTVTRRIFDFRMRQAPGPLNALGRVKFMFPNAFSVYLHDTPARELFGETSRAFSSGCIRLSRPLELAELLLSDDPRWSRDAIDGAVSSGVEQTVRLARPIPVHLLYWTAWIDAEGVAQHRADIYGRDSPVLRELRELPPG